MFRFGEPEYTLDSRSTITIEVIRDLAAYEATAILAIKHAPDAPLKPRYRDDFERERKLSFRVGESIKRVTLSNPFRKSPSQAIALNMEVSIVGGSEYGVMDRSILKVEQESASNFGVNSIQSSEPIQQQIQESIQSSYFNNGDEMNSNEVQLILKKLEELTAMVEVMTRREFLPTVGSGSISSCPIMDWAAAHAPQAPAPPPEPITTYFSWVDAVLLNGATNTIAVYPTSKVNRLQWRLYQNELQFRGSIIPGDLEPGYTEMSAIIFTLPAVLGITTKKTADGAADSYRAIIEFSPQSDGSCVVRLKGTGYRKESVSFENVGIYL